VAMGVENRLGHDGSGPCTESALFTHNDLSDLADICTDIFQNYLQRLFHIAQLFA